MNEKELQKTITTHLTYLRKLGRLFFIRANAGMIPTTYTTAKGQNRSFTVRLAPKGTSDLIIFLPRQKTLFLELKGYGKKQSPEQFEFERTIKALGYDYYCIDNYDAFIALLSTYSV